MQDVLKSQVTQKYFLCDSYVRGSENLKKLKVNELLETILAERALPYVTL